jgi:large subunit ribosomal protein L3
MCKGLIGKKIGMTGVFSADGKYVPVTVVEVGPCVVTQIKTVATDGYNALQLGFGTKKPSKINKPVKGHLAKSGGGSYAALKEFAVDDPEQYELGQSVALDIFQVGERVDVSGTTKGRGFAGVIKRHGFARGPMTHGSKSIRIPGSIGCSAWPSKVIRGKKMPGHYGNARKTIKNLTIYDIRPEENLVLIQGAVPGHRSALIMLNKRRQAGSGS